MRILKHAVIAFVISVIIISAANDVNATTVNVSIPQGTSEPGCETTNSCFQPYSPSISVDDAVTWTNNDSAAHTVTSGNVEDFESVATVFDSGLFPSGATFSHTFEEAGEFPYFCMIHPWMTGSITVSSQLDISFSNLGIVDANGEPLSEIDVGQQVAITASIVNNDDSQQSFAYVIEIRDEDGVTVGGPMWVTGVLNPHTGVNQGISQTFDLPGNYQIIARLVDDVQNPQVLAPQLSMDVSISGGVQPQTIEIYTDKEKYFSGDTITVVGAVSPVVGPVVTVQVFSKTNVLIRVDEVDVLSSGKYIMDVAPGGVLWDNNQGTFTIMATYGTMSKQKQIQYTTVEMPEVETPLSTDLDVDGNMSLIVIAAIVVTGVGGAAAFLMRRKKPDEQTGGMGSISKPPPSQPEEREPDYSLDDSKLR